MCEQAFTFGISGSWQTDNSCCCCCWLSDDCIVTSGDRDRSVGSGDLVFPLEDVVENIAADDDSCGGGDATVAEAEDDGAVDGGWRACDAVPRPAIRTTPLSCVQGQELDGGLQRPSVDEDDFATSTACCDLDQLHSAACKVWYCMVL